PVPVNVGQSLRALPVRMVTSLGGAELGPAGPIRWWVKDAEGLHALDEDLAIYQRDIGVSFKSPEERQESPWAGVIFDESYALQTQRPDGSSAWEIRALP